MGNGTSGFNTEASIT